MRLLLDTHVLLWWLGEPSELAEAALDAIADPENVVYLSAVVVWEIRIKESIGKLDLPRDFREVLESQQLVDLPMTARHAHGLGELPLHHRDPFDRLLVSQARIEDLTLVTRDADIGRYDVPILAA